ncbi:hypothetical protein STAQ_30730 [Allostella sp. ATCC 35155]|nr:hypothetical protein STAQ_30730 [Stella sp. ATCC 35155]
MRVLLDMNLSPRWVGYMSSVGIESVHWSAVGAPGATDRELMAWASDNACIVMTSDLDFPAILAATGAGGPSVLLVRSGPLTPEALGPIVRAALSTVGAELLAGAIVSLDGDRIRLRVLPLGS